MLVFQVAPDFASLVTPILFFYGFSVSVILLISPVLYGMTRFSKRLADVLDDFVGIRSEPEPLTEEEYSAKILGLRRMSIHRGAVIAGVFYVLATAFVLLYVIAYAHDHPSLYSAPLYAGIVLLAAAGAAVVWILPIGVITYLAGRAELRRRMRFQSHPADPQ